jgi:hypothetical protein
MQKLTGAIFGVAFLIAGILSLIEARTGVVVPHRPGHEELGLFGTSSSRTQPANAWFSDESPDWAFSRPEGNKPDYSNWAFGGSFDDNTSWGSPSESLR